MQGTVWTATFTDGAWVKFEHGADPVAAKAHALAEYGNDVAHVQTENGAAQARCNSLYGAEEGPAETARMKRIPVANKVDHLPGPKWIAADGASHSITFHRLCPGAQTSHIRDFFGWQMAHMCDGQVWQVVEIADTLRDVCDSATGALWALRGMAARSMRSDVRCTRGH